MKVKVIEECGLDSALTGLSLSYEQDVDNMLPVAERLAFKGEGHNKFLESIAVWLDIEAPRYWWLQFDTYRVGVTKQSGSTMHTIMKRPLTDGDFEGEIPLSFIHSLNEAIRAKDFDAVKRMLPESFLQRRVVCLNYMALQRIIRQRKSHRLAEWQTFVAAIMDQVDFPFFLEKPDVVRVSWDKNLCRKL